MSTVLEGNDEREEIWMNGGRLQGMALPLSHQSAVFSSSCRLQSPGPTSRRQWSIVGVAGLNHKVVQFAFCQQQIICLKHRHDRSNIVFNSRESSCLIREGQDTGGSSSLLGLQNKIGQNVPNRFISMCQYLYYHFGASCMTIDGESEQNHRIVAVVRVGNW